MKAIQQVQEFFIIASAVVYAVTSYVWTAFLLWWNDNGENVLSTSICLIFNFVDVIADIVFDVQSVYRWVKFNLYRFTDSVYFQLIGV